MKRTIFLVGTAAIVTAALFTTLPSALPVDVEPDVFRETRVYRGSPVAGVSCRGDVCSAALPASVAATLPTDMGNVDVTVSLTVEYATTPGDGPLIDMEMKAPGERSADMRPGPLQLRGGARTTTTLVWLERNVAPGGGDHVFDWAIEASHLAPPFRATITEAVLVLEATPS